MNTRSKSNAGIIKQKSPVPFSNSSRQKSTTSYTEPKRPSTPTHYAEPTSTKTTVTNTQPVISSLRSFGGSRRFYGSANAVSGIVRNGLTAIPQALANLSIDPEIEHFRLSSSKCRLFRVSWDKGWGCTYRCIQSLYSILVQTDPYKRGLPFSFTYQNIPFIQEDIEKAWIEHKIDECGGSTFQFSLKGKKDWIGATEVASLLRSHSINAELHDFYLCSKPQHKSPDTTHSHKALIDFVKKYFDWTDDQQDHQSTNLLHNSLKETCIDPRNLAKKGFVMEHKFPLYFQTNGHSMIIIGIVQFKDKSFGLALYDSQESSKVPRIMRASSLKDPAYQIVQIDGLIVGPEMQEKAKRLIGNIHCS